MVSANAHTGSAVQGKNSSVSLCSRPHSKICTVYSSFFTYSAYDPAFRSRRPLCSCIAVILFRGQIGLTIAREFTRLEASNRHALKKPQFCGLSAYSNSSLQAPYTSASSTCGYNSPICSLQETVRISPRTVAAAKEAPCEVVLFHSR